MEQKRNAEIDGHVYRVRVTIEQERGRYAECSNCDSLFLIDHGSYIGEALLTPGDPSPVCRCPLCGELAYQTIKTPQCDEVEVFESSSARADQLEAIGDALQNGDAKTIADLLGTNLSARAQADVIVELSGYLRMGVKP